MVLELEPELVSDGLLTLFYFRIGKFIDVSTFETDNMIVVASPVEFEDGITPFEIMATNQTCRFELGQDPIDGCKANFLSFIEEDFVDIFCTQMVAIVVLALQDF